MINSFGKSNSCGCSTLINRKLRYKILNNVVGESGRLLLTNIEISYTVFSMVNMYAPNDYCSRNIFFNSAYNTIHKNAIGIKLIGMNDILTKQDRITSSIVLKKYPVPNLSKIIQSFKLIDAWRLYNPNKTQFTWRRKNGIEKSRIDIWFFDNSHANLILSADIRPAQISSTDYLAISLKIELAQDRGPGIWKFNNSLLNDTNYINLIQTLIHEHTQHNNNTNAQLQWEIIKCEIKSKTMSYAKEKAQTKRNIQTNLETELNTLYAIDRPNEEQKERIEYLESRIKTFYADKARGAQIRARLDYIEENEDNLRLFKNLENSRQTRKVMSTIRVKDKRISNISEILKHEVEFFKTLYQSDNVDTKDILINYLNTNKNAPKLTQTEAQQCDGNLSDSECYTALLGMKKNKSPGSDGLTVKFYQTFWPTLKTYLVNSINYGFTNNELSISQKYSVLTLLYRKGDPEDIENWRPISLLNVDYKIAALQKVLPKIINQDQQGFIKKRFIGNNIRQIQDIIDFTEDTNTEGAILFLDFRKAFDTVEWNFLFETMTFFWL